MVKTIDPIPDKTDKYKISYDQFMEVEIGDINNITDFVPQAKIKRWEDETSFTIKYNTNKKIKPTKEINNGKEKLKWKDNDKEIHFYATDVRTYQENGQEVIIPEGFEFEYIFKNAPLTNTIELDIIINNMVCYYQPELTQEEIDNGDFRPEIVVGSYAVYHATKQLIHKGQLEAEKYRTGKCFHIYRPKSTDALGIESWCNLNIDIVNNKLTITVPQSFLDNATYPIRVDPEFGYHPAGGGGSNTIILANYAYSSLFTSPASISTGTSISAYVRALVGTDNLKGCIWLHSDLTLVTNAVGAAVNYGTVAAYQTSSFGTPPNLSASTGYLLGIISDSSTYIYYDAGDANQEHIDTTNSYTTPQNMGTAVHSTNKYSFYCTYTEPAGWTHKYMGIVNASISKINTIAKTSIAKVSGI